MVDPVGLPTRSSCGVPGHCTPADRPSVRGPRICPGYTSSRGGRDSGSDESTHPTVVRGVGVVPLSLCPSCPDHRGTSGTSCGRPPPPTPPRLHGGPPTRPTTPHLTHRPDRASGIRLSLLPRPEDQLKVYMREFDGARLVEYPLLPAPRQ